MCLNCQDGVKANFSLPCQSLLKLPFIKSVGLRQYNILGYDSVNPCCCSMSPSFF